MSHRPSHRQNARLVPPITTGQLRAFLASIDSLIDPNKLGDTTPFTEAGADSLDFFSIISEIQNETDLDIPDEDVQRVTTLTDLAAYLNRRMS